MCVLLERINVENNTTNNLNVGAKIMMFYSGVIMKSG